MVGFRRGEPGGQPGLGNNANTVTPSVGRDLRRRRFQWRQQSRDWLLDDTRQRFGDDADVVKIAPRLAKCGWSCSPLVAVHKGKSARLSGVQTCASVWGCPCCASIIRAGRAQEVMHAADWWSRESPDNSLMFVTFTVRHYLEDSLETSLDVLTGAYRRLLRGAPWKRFSARHGIQHMIKAVETTLGYDNGWHAHLHVLFFADRHSTAAARREAVSWLSARWASMVVREGGRRPSEARGVVLRDVEDGRVAAQYVAKLQESDQPSKQRPRRWNVGKELTRIDSKKGRLSSLVPFDLLETDGLEAGEIERQRAYWLEYVETTRGRRALTWSRGLKKACGLDDLTDDDLVDAETEEAEADDVALMIFAKDWRSIQNSPAVISRILELVELDRADEVAELVPCILGGLGVLAPDSA